MNVILTGPDNSGKTTLADIMVKEGIFRYYHSGGPPRSMEEEAKFHAEQFQICNQQDHHYVLDRVSCIAQQVYRDGRLAEPMLVKHLQALLAIEPLPVIIYCRPPTDRLMAFENFTWRPEETEAEKAYILENQHKFIDRYDTVMKDIPHIVYDFLDQDASRYLTELLINHRDGELYHLMNLAKEVANV